VSDESVQSIHVALFPALPLPSLRVLMDSDNKKALSKLPGISERQHKRKR